MNVQLTSGKSVSQNTTRGRLHYMPSSTRSTTYKY